MRVCENPGGALPPPAPLADAYGHNLLFMTF